VTNMGRILIPIRLETSSVCFHPHSETLQIRRISSHPAWGQCRLRGRACELTLPLLFNDDARMRRALPL
jgi:hypothetical protein